MVEPEQLRERPHHGRFPIPFVTAVDELGKPDFRVHDDRRRFECALHSLCQLCGKPLMLGETVFVAQEARKLVFGEPPMHADCFEFAWEVCPWLAGGGWSDRWRAEARDLEILPPPPDSGEVTILWAAGGFAWTCVSDPERRGGWLWALLPPSLGLPDLVGSAPVNAQPCVVWAETRSRGRS